mmetsp:Transcript_5121/g.15061  ORF Transcript_5121/g.15061 Transcript_5121/m.15061 type:complete len:243 (-) Transcript_5121:87-815(-)
MQRPRRSDAGGQPSDRRRRAQTSWHGPAPRRRGRARELRRIALAQVWTRLGQVAVRTRPRPPAAPRPALDVVAEDPRADLEAPRRDLAEALQFSSRLRFDRVGLARLAREALDVLQRQADEVHALEDADRLARQPDDDDNLELEPVEERKDLVHRLVLARDVRPRRLDELGAVDRPRVFYRVPDVVAASTRLRPVVRALLVLPAVRVVRVHLAPEAEELRRGFFGHLLDLVRLRRRFLKRSF